MTVHDVPQFVLDRAGAKDPIFTADEVAVWPDGLLNQLAAGGVLKASGNAESATCDACGHDHVEKVEYIKSPPNTELRAYITCPENGRVRVPLGRLKQWVVDKQKLLDAGLVHAPHQESKKRQGKEQPAKLSWTQLDLDEAIREHKAKRASRYNDLVSGVKQGKAGAKKSARELFGRNAIVRALGVRSAAMVSGSSVWQAIADELGLRGPSSSRSAANRHSKRVGLDIALEEQAEATSEPVLETAIRRETIQLIETSMPATEAQATIEKLQRGDLTDDAARELVDILVQQQQDDRNHRARQAP